MLFVSKLFGQNLDSLNLALKNAKHDTVRLNLYVKLCEACDVKDNLKYGKPAIELIDRMLSKTNNESERKNILKQKAFVFLCFAVYYKQIEGNSSLKELQYRKKILDVSIELNDEIDIANAITQITYWYTDQGNYPKALEYNQNGLALFKQLNYKKGMALLFGNIANLYARLDDIKASIENFEKSLVIYKELKDTNGIAESQNDLGYNYGTTHNLKKALEYFNQSVLLFKTSMNHEGLRSTYNIIGLMYLNNDMWDEALIYFEKSLLEDEQLPEKTWTRGILCNIGLIHRLKGDIDQALEYHFKALKVAEETNSETQVSWVFNKLSEDYFQQKNYSKAKEYNNRYLAIITKSTFFSSIQGGELLASKIDSAIGNHQEAFEHYKRYIRLKEKLNNDEFRKAANEEKYRNEYEQQKREDKVEQDKKDIKTSEEKQQQQIIMYSVAVVLCLTIVFSVLLYKRFRLTHNQKEIIEQQKHIVEEKHKEITDSINYAERIQRSFLATKELLDENLTDYFVFFKPKDIVSGDFYWASILSNDNFALVTADSTGHGVPGAIMSLLNITSIESAIKDGFLQPADILNVTRRTIIERLKKDGSAEGGKDGMDCSLISFDFTNKKLTVSAANNPVWIVRKNELGVTEAIEIKPDKMPVGKHDKDSTSFTQHEIQLQSGDVVYTLTDGFPDQFGGEKGKKFMSKNLRELLVANSHLPMHEQHQLLNKTFTDWVGNLEQVDDVCIIGIRI